MGPIDPKGTRASKIGAMIDQNYVNFFKELENNNNKEWFHQHKKVYETQVKQPFLALLELLIPELLRIDPRISTNTKEAIFRINRDVRFSRNKTPYNTLLKAGFSPLGKEIKLTGLLFRYKRR